MITPTQIRKIAAPVAFTALTAGSLAAGTGLASAGVAGDTRGPHTPATSAANDAQNQNTHRAKPFYPKPNTQGGQHSHDQGR